MVLNGIQVVDINGHFKYVEACNFISFKLIENIHAVETADLL